VIVLDTNVLSEMLRPAPDERVAAWLGSQPMSALFTTTITQAEILYGVALLPAGRRRDVLFAAVHPIFDEEMAGRVLPFDVSAATVYADLAAGRRQSGQPISQFDAQIAAIVRSRGGSLATRNIADFVACGIEVLDPWSAT
jgi:predicted nucleic acid-binding protein